MLTKKLYEKKITKLIIQNENKIINVKDNVKMTTIKNVPKKGVTK
jgi:hypothetical protein